MAPCGHPCLKRCSQPCDPVCKTRVEYKYAPCDHVASFPCGVAAPLNCEKCARAEAKRLKEEKRQEKLRVDREAREAVEKGLVDMAVVTSQMQHLTERYQTRKLLVDSDAVVVGVQLGAGGQGSVCAGRYQEEDVAIKIIDIAGVAVNPHLLLELAQKEIDHLDKLKGQPHIIPLRAVCVLPAQVWMVMPRMRCSLQDVMHFGPTPSLATRLRWLHETAVGLKAAHTRTWRTSI